MKWGRIVVILAACAAAGGASWYGMKAWREINATKDATIPVAKVQRGDLTLTVTAKAELRGGNPEVLTAPLIGGTELHLTTLKEQGEPVKEGEVVVEFDTTEQDYKLKEAQADLAEAEQKLAQADNDRQAQQEEDSYAIEKAKADITTAELDVRKNPLLPSITARENTLALEQARDHLTQLEHNVANRRATGDAAIAIQQAGRDKAASQAKTAQQNIDAMTLKAHRDGYFSIRANTNVNYIDFGMTLPVFQSGDTVRPGMAVAEIPDLKNWELAANIAELDRGHIAVGQKVNITVIAVSGRQFHGTVKDLGASGGPPWDRHFECKIGLDDPSAELRPGMSALVVVTEDQLHGVLSLPAQALFENDGRTYVYVKQGATFVPKDVKLTRRSEMRVVVDGLTEGQEVALSNPTEMEKKKAAGGSALQSLGK
ncbi:MAG TPA: efflux RND transporter periplasmic adaptor subunit [Bryobacteraceae bacterium]|nr:efflux RND transporter periplasmic adaptor subunit [Bryobacteraceae bacterium]